jgi:hypothetical protein
VREKEVGAEKSDPEQEEEEAGKGEEGCEEGCRPTDLR